MFLSPGMAIRTRVTPPPPIGARGFKDKSDAGLSCFSRDARPFAITEWNDTGMRGVIDNPQDRMASVNSSLGI